MGPMFLFQSIDFAKPELAAITFGTLSELMKQASADFSFQNFVPALRFGSFAALRSTSDASPPVSCDSAAA